MFYPCSHYLLLQCVESNPGGIDRGPTEDELVVALLWVICHVQQPESHCFMSLIYWHLSHRSLMVGYLYFWTFEGAILAGMMCKTEILAFALKWHLKYFITLLFFFCLLSTFVLSNFRRVAIWNNVNNYNMDNIFFAQFQQ